MRFRSFLRESLKLDKRDGTGLVRYCNECKNEVYFCQNDEEVRHRKLSNQCVAVTDNERGSISIGIPGCIASAETGELS